MRTIQAIILSSIFLSLMAASAYCADTVRVATRENAVREDCRFFAPVVVRVIYGDPLEVLSEEGDWLKVKFEDTEGCIHKTAITTKKFKKVKSRSSGDTASGGASSEEVALAGKGFNPAVEKQYRLDNPDMDFATIDDIEDSTVSHDALAEFIEEGGLREPQ